MEDFSKTSVTKNHKNSFDKMISSIASELETIKREYYKYWNAINEDRKVLAYCVEECIKLTKKAGIKVPKNLDQFERLELVDFILENSYKYDPEDRDNIITLAKTIKEKYLMILVNVPKINELETKLSKYHVDEKDFDDEVEIDLSVYRKKATIEVPAHTDELSEEELDKLVDEAVSLYDSDSEYIIIDINNSATLLELALKFYDEEDYWYYLYDYKDNKTKLDIICDEKNITLDELIKTPGLLKGLSLKFPEEIKTFISIETQDKSRL